MENQQTPLPDYRHLFKRVDEKELARLLELALDRSLIVKFCHLFGLGQEGQDLESTAIQVLAAQLARDCFEREVTAAQVVRTLVQTSAGEITRVAATSPERVGALLGDRTSAYCRECGRLATAMLLDEREAVHAPAIELLNRPPANQARTGVSEESASPYLRGDSVLDGEADLNGGPGDARQSGSSALALIEARRHSADLEKRNRILEDRVRELQQRPADERVSLFVDVQNMWYAARQQHGISARLDFEKLIQTAVGERRLIRAYAYLIQTPEVDQSGFVTRLEQFSYEVKRKDLRRRSDGSAKGDWDMEMAIDMIRMADKVDVVILASGDGDFVSLVQLLKELGPRVEVFSFPHNTARDLMEAADRYQPIDRSLLTDMDPVR